MHSCPANPQGYSLFPWQQSLEEGKGTQKTERLPKADKIISRMESASRWLTRERGQARSRCGGNWMRRGVENWLLKERGRRSKTREGNKRWASQVGAVVRKGSLPYTVLRCGDPQYKRHERREETEQPHWRGSHSSINGTLNGDHRKAGKVIAHSYFDSLFKIFFLTPDCLLILLSRKQLVIKFVLNREMFQRNLANILRSILEMFFMLVVCLVFLGNEAYVLPWPDNKIREMLRGILSGLF